MKTSNAISARATEPPRPTGRSSGRQPSPISADGFALTGPADLPDARFNAYRKDLADVALAGRVVAPHYAEPLARVIARSTSLLAGPGAGSEAICELEQGDPFEVVENSVGWAWGYGGRDRLVGYVAADALTC